jgi:hypothetical protein
MIGLYVMLGGMAAIAVTITLLDYFGRRRPQKSHKR